MILPLLLLELVGLRISALSSSSPPDLFASPAYHVVVNRDLILNETAFDLLANPPNASIRYEMMRSTGGQTFLCSIQDILPAQSLNVLEHETPQSSPVMNAEAGLQKGLSLLEPLKGGCLYQKQGWFTYAFCHGSEIRQFHEIRIAGSNVPGEDTSSEAYTLGFYPANAIDEHRQPSGNSAEVVASQAHGGLSDILASDANQDVDPVNAKRYLVQRWVGGTLCDMTGMERRVEVQFHCNTQSTDRIALIRETAICEYVMVIHTPRLCGESYFLGSGSSDSASQPSNAITCQPIAKKAPYGSISDNKQDPLNAEHVSEPVLPSTVSIKASTPTESSQTMTPVDSSASEVEEGGKSSEDEAHYFFLDAETGEILHQPLGDSEAGAETSKEEKDAQEALHQFASALEQSLANAFKQSLGQAKEKKKDGMDEEAINRLSGIVKKLAKSGLTAQKASNQPVRQVPQQAQNVPLGTAQHQALKGMYGSNFEEDKEDSSANQGHAVRDEL